MTGPQEADHPVGPDRTSEAFFEALYRQSQDPWGFETSDYEQHRYRASLRALSGESFDRVFEPGCSIGVLTERLAVQAAEIQAIDTSPTAVAKARERCKSLPHVYIEHGALPHHLPPGDFDLIVLSEIGYYFPLALFRSLIDLLLAKLRPGGSLLAVHWLGVSADHCLSGDLVHDELRAALGQPVLHERHPGFRLDRWIRP